MRIGVTRNTLNLQPTQELQLAHDFEYTQSNALTPLRV